MPLEPPSLEHSAQQSSRKIYSVSELTRDIKQLLEDRYPLIWVSGEISNLRVPASGHAYFSLKDTKAQLAAVMFRGQLRQVRFEMEDGLSVLAMGRISVYAPRGGYQMILEYVEPKGVGALQIAFEQLKEKLGKEGLFDEQLKKNLPFLPMRPAVVTSPTGAVIQDILNVMRRRFPGLGVDIYPVRVQGDDAAKEIVHAIQLANQRSVNDVMILARGGGSLEDLSAFNDEGVARAIAASSIPIVSAVGHETDFTIADFVSDLRAPTPSAAAELTVPVKGELKARCVELEQRGRRALLNIIGQLRQKTALLSRALVHPGKRAQDARLHVDQLVQQIERAMDDMVQRRRLVCDALNISLDKNNPLTTVRQHRSALELLWFKLAQSMHTICDGRKKRLTGADAMLRALNPDAVLQRGYSITRIGKDGAIAMDAASIRHGQLLEIQMAKGRIEALAQKRNSDRQGDEYGEHETDL